jgi:hypothetical protein
MFILSMFSETMWMHPDDTCPPSNACEQLDEIITFHRMAA